MRVVAIYKLADCLNKFRFPLYTCPISAGSPSFGDDHVADYVSIIDLIEHPEDSFFLRVWGDSMVGANIHSGNLLLVDGAVEPKDGDIVVAAIDSELTVKRLKCENDQLMLVAENPIYEPLSIGVDTDFHIWGVVTDVLHSLRKGKRSLGEF
jgi:DNA polymerase V